MKLALAGDTMLGRKVAEAIGERGPDALVAEEVVAVAREADVFVLNLGTGRAPARSGEAVLLPRATGGDPPADAARRRLRHAGEQPRARLRPRGAAGHAQPSARSWDRVCRRRRRSRAGAGACDAAGGWILAG